MKSSRTVLLFLPTPPPFAGPEVASDLLLRKLEETHKGEIFHVRSNVRTDNRQKGNLNASGIFSFLRLYFRFVGALVRHRPAVVCFLLSSNRVGFLRDSVIVFTAKWLGCRLVAHYRGANFDNFYRLASPLLRRYVRCTLDRVDQVIVQSNALKRMFEGLLPIEAIVVLPNGLDFSHWSMPVRRPGSRVRLLFVGHVTFAKGFYDLVCAYRELRTRHTEIELWFAGETMDNERQKFRVAELLAPAEQQFFFTNVETISNTIKEFLESPGAQNARYLNRISGEAKREAFEQADIFVLPSYTEGFSMAVLEAMAYGLPIVATGVGALPEILRNGHNGFLVPTGDPRELAAKLEILIQNPATRLSMGRTNAEEARARYDVTRVAAELWRILTETSHTPQQEV